MKIRKEIDVKRFLFSIGRSVRDAVISSGRIIAKVRFGRKGKMKTSAKIGEYKNKEAISHP